MNNVGAADALMRIFNYRRCGMSHFSMCQDGECPSRETCYRFNAKVGYAQSYANFARAGRKKCDYYINSNKPRTGAEDAKSINHAVRVVRQGDGKEV